MSHRCLILALMGTLLMGTGTARAQDDVIIDSAGIRYGGTPLTYAQRGVVLADKTLRIDIGPPDFALLHSGWMVNGYGFALLHFDPDPGPDDTDAYFGAGLAFGITDRVELGALLLPTRLSGDFSYLDLQIYSRIRLIDSDAFELAIQPALSFPTNSDFLGMSIGVPMMFHIADRVRIDLGAEIEMLFDVDDDPGPDENYFNLDFPIAVAFSITEQGFVGPRSGIYIWDFDHVIVPLGVFGGYTINGGGSFLVDLTGEFTFFINDNHLENLRWQMVFGANFYLDFG